MSRKRIVPECTLGAPCSSNDCHFCNKGRRSAAIKAVIDLLLPARPQRVVLAASFLFPFVSPGVMQRLHRNACLQRLRKVLAAAGLGSARVVAGFRLHYSKLGYELEFWAVIDLPASANLPLVKKRLASEMLSHTIWMNYSYKIVRSRALLASQLQKIFGWDRQSVHAMLAGVPTRYRPELRHYLKSIPSSKRVWVNGLR